MPRGATGAGIGIDRQELRCPAELRQTHWGSLQSDSSPPFSW